LADEFKLGQEYESKNYVKLAGTLNLVQDYELSLVDALNLEQEYDLRLAGTPTLDKSMKVKIT
jgi:hypothetical protein